MISRVVVGMDSGFSAYPLCDPLIIADTSGDGRLLGDDASYVVQKALGMTRPEIPDLPSPAITLVSGGVDPVVSIASGIVATPDSVVNVPVSIAGPSDAGLLCVDLQFTYDTKLLDLMRLRREVSRLDGRELEPDGRGRR